MDPDSIAASWAQVYSVSPEATITYSVYDPTNPSNVGGYVTKTVQKNLSDLFGSDAKVIRTLTPNKDGIVNIQKINFGLSDKDIILYDGEVYKGNETIELQAGDITAKQLNFLIYLEKYLGVESKMNITFSHADLYFDGNGNGKIDGYFDESAGLFMVDETTGDFYCGTIKDKLPEEIIEPRISADGKVLQYFFKTYYSITPRSLLSSKKDTAQILPCFVPQDTDEASLAKLTDEQKAYRMIKTSGTSVLPYDKKSKRN